MAAICVYCASSDSIDASYFELAHEVGQRIAGGGQVSMMGAVARAARAGGAYTVGVIPEHLLRYEIGDRDAQEFHVVETMRQRKQLMDDKADAFLVLPGGIGTFEELFEVWSARSLGMHDKPVVMLDPDGFFEPLWQFMGDLSQRGFVRPAVWDSVSRVKTIDAAFAVIEESLA